ncbi:unnamed protein product [Bursaphelenchus xylophilus]|uniref:Nucleolar protein 16 n=1 Tax=Bursaphelenchus xylophilus TaxID=6326 RepID=A0A1I7RXW1_BURXY|nr:unnamed protein product [Bursaphelenchus xylophilus]CAG9125205.1 unnamed protein product [Bursaphelenchus xylophilus]
MPRSVKAVKRSRVKKTFTNKKNAAKRQKAKARKKVGQPGPGHVLHEVWDSKKSVRQNLKAAGLVFNPNEVVPIEKKKKDIVVDMVDLDAVSSLASLQEQKVRSKKAKGLAKKIEADAKAATAKQSNRPPPRLRQPELEFCTKMIQKHGVDFEAMARDHENIYQNTAKQIQRKIELFKKSQAYKEVVGEAMEE